MPVAWQKVGEYTDILYEHAEGIAKITINRPEVRNAFRPETVFELIDAFALARDDAGVGVVLFTGAGDEAFCSGGDQRVRGDAARSPRLAHLARYRFEELRRFFRSFDVEEPLRDGLKILAADGVFVREQELVVGRDHQPHGAA